LGKYNEYSLKFVSCLALAMQNTGIRSLDYRIRPKVEVGYTATRV